jgi:hypothetical protein
MTAVPGARYTGLDEKLYQVAEIDVSDFPEETFNFAPPPSAMPVKEFEDKQTQEQAKIVGKRVAALTFRNSEGKKVTLQSFAGKPVLLDFWATLANKDGRKQVIKP